MTRLGRLPKGRAFDEVYQKGTAVSGPLVVLRVIRRGGGESRWGFAVGKRLDRRAVVRNTVRRRLKEAARRVGVSPGWDIVVTARHGCLGAEFASLEAALRKAVKRGGVAGEQSG